MGSLPAIPIGEKQQRDCPTQRDESAKSSQLGRNRDEVYVD